MTCLTRPLRLLTFLCFIGVALAVTRVNAWGWWYDSGAPIAHERRVNIVAQMLTNGSDADQRLRC